MSVSEDSKPVESFSSDQWFDVATVEQVLRALEICERHAERVGDAECLAASGRWDDLRRVCLKRLAVSMSIVDVQVTGSGVRVSGKVEP